MGGCVGHPPRVEETVGAPVGSPVSGSSVNTEMEPCKSSLVTRFDTSKNRPDECTRNAWPMNATRGCGYVRLLASTPIKWLVVWR